MNSLRLLAALAALFLAAACAKKDAASAASAAPTKHEHHPPHGGTPVVLGQELYHLELVREPAAGTLTAYVFDGELENFIRVKAPSLEIIATVGGEKRSLT